MENKIILPSILTEETRFYKENEALLKQHLNKPYISYSSVNSWEDKKYKADFIKQKFCGIKLPSGVYAEFGSYCGHALEHGVFPDDNPHGFTGHENMNLSKLRPLNAEYEKIIVIDMEDYFIVGFIDIFHEYESGKVLIQDQKTGGAGKEKEYAAKDYIQVVLYAYAIELMYPHLTVGKTNISFIRRTGSHVKPPLHISTEQFIIPLEYNQDRIQYAIEKVDRVVNEISDLYKIYLEYFN